MNEQQIKLFSSKKTDNWQTPKILLEKIYSEYNINHDPCPRHPTEDGLLVDWKERVFVNPPYSQVNLWLQKAHIEIQKRSEVIVFLVFANTDTGWFHNHVMGTYPYCDVVIKFIRGRLKFVSDEGVLNSAMRPSMLVVFKKSSKGEK